MVIGSNSVFHSFDLGNRASILLISDGLCIWIMMCILDVDSHFIAKQSCNFFQSFTYSLWVHEIDHNNEDGVANDEDKEESPGDILDGDWRDLNQHDCDGVECTERHGVASSSDGRWHDFGWVCIPKGVHDEGVADKVTEHETNGKATEKQVGIA
jgi:hypothetical protein